MFGDELPEADLFILCHVIENWRDDKSHILLKKAFDKLPEGMLVKNIETNIYWIYFGCYSSIELLAQAAQLVKRWHQLQNYGNDLIQTNTKMKH